MANPNNKPFCDGTHFKINFDGTEDFDNVPYEQMAKTIDGPELALKDAEILCASARFCHRGGDIWDQIPQTDDPKIKENCVRNACDCPSGRLTVIDKATGTVVEPKLGPGNRRHRRPLNGHRRTTLDTRQNPNHFR